MTSNPSPLISICIPTYNRSSYLNKCLQSIVGYPGNDIEIIISDNASPDDTAEMIKKYSDPRIRYYRNEQNIGLRKNIVDSMKYAKGEFIFCLSDDDMLIPGSIEVIKQFISGNSVDAFKCDLITFNINSRNSSLYSYFDKSIAAGVTDYVSQAKVYQSSHILSGCGYRTSAMPFEVMYQNIDLWYPSQFLIGMLSKKLGYIAQPLVIHIWENELFWDNIKSNELFDSEVKNLEVILKETKETEFVKEVGFSIATNLLSHNMQKELPSNLLAFVERQRLESWKAQRSKKRSKFKKVVDAVTFRKVKS